MDLMTQAVENIYRYGKSILTIDSKKQSIVFYADDSTGALAGKVINHFGDDIEDQIYDLDTEEISSYVAFLAYYSINDSIRKRDLVSLSSEENNSTQENRVSAINELYSYLLPMLSITQKNVERTCMLFEQGALLYEHLANIKNSLSNTPSSLSVYDIISSISMNFSHFLHTLSIGTDYWYDINESSSEVEYHDAVCKWNNFLNKLFIYELSDKENDDADILEFKKLGVSGDFLTSKHYDMNPAVDCDESIRNLQIALLTRSKSAVLVGPPGVGKTAIVEGLAYLIREKQVPKALENKKILKINPSSIVSDCKYVGELEAKVEDLMNYLTKNKDIILFLDEMHTVIGAGAGNKSNMDLANLIKPYIDRGQIKMIGATTTDEYDEYIKSDEAFNRRFIEVKVTEPKEKTIYRIINSHIQSLEKTTNIAWNFDINDSSIIINQLIDATKKKNRVYNDKRYNPDISISILEKAFAIALLENCQTLEVNNVAQAIRSTECLYESQREKSANRLLRQFEQKCNVASNIIVFPSAYTKKKR